MQALKMFIAKEGGQASGGSGAGSQNQFIGMAMGQAAKLFDQQNAAGNTVCSTSFILHLPSLFSSMGVGD